MPRSAALVLSLIFVALAAACGGADGPEQLAPTAPTTSSPTPAVAEGVEVRIRDLVIQAETAITAEERGQGLSDRPSLAEDAGMLFFMNEPRIPGFHMRNMQFPLDFIWISAAGVIVDVTENVPHPAEAGETLSGISPNEPVLFVLEVNAGVVQSASIEIGDEVAFEPDILQTLLCAKPTITVEAAADGNLLANASFEDGAESWCSLDSDAWGTPFRVSNDRALNGENSALLQLRSKDGGEVRVYGVVQEVAPEELPQLLSGAYFVENWQQGTALQYLQAVVIVWEAQNAPSDILGSPNHQIRYLLAGVDTPPTFFANARYIFISDEAPRVGEWIRFDRDVRKDFEDLWGAVPERFDRLRVLFEVRWDGREADDGPAAADVYYDDLYLGSGS